MKRCSKCKKEQLLSEFCNDKRSLDGKASNCKSCGREFNRISYQKHKEKRLEENKKYNQIKRNFFLDYLSKQKCVDCGDDRILVLQFDHLEPRNSGKCVTEMVYTHGLEKLKEEIKKCEVVCANCHSIRTFTRKKSDRLRYV